MESKDTAVEHTEVTVFGETKRDKSVFRCFFCWGSTDSGEEEKPTTIEARSVEIVPKSVDSIPSQGTVVESKAPIETPDQTEFLAKKISPEELMFVYGGLLLSIAYFMLKKMFSS